ncbi:putative membrane protein [Rubellimicrobium mesophilum DSM 19309]|uniref:Putative membrane protein n=1 Tax=Rubellimicrobium mesophilum DSM 19309 TaxID=442562 RepID=A0A017HIZ8_9RHOB|nr:antibiotic biosynthesis monooxygenase [Rubellimicrobium mesophilum]EYD74310.1 putative membrane protein [Rubellimicrobium mesophilum DSM 19309]
MDGSTSPSRPEPETPQDRSISVLVTRAVPEGQQEALEREVETILDTARDEPGHLGSVVLRGREGDKPQLNAVLRFTDEAAWTRWQAGPHHQQLLERKAARTGAPAEVRLAQGIEGWFDLPGQSGGRAPPKWRMAAVTWITILPVLLAVSYALKPLVDDWPQWARLGVSTLITVPLMTWVAMPAATHLFRRWLYPDGKPQGETQAG